MENEQTVSPEQQAVAWIHPQATQWNLLNPYYETDNYVVVSDPAEEAYGVVNKKTKHCEVRSCALPQALYAIRSLEKHLGEFYESEPKKASPVLSIIRSDKTE